MALADTSCTGDPRQILERVTACQGIVGDTRLSLHLHDATGWALANLTTAMQLGVDTFDVTLGGLGGCPFLPGAPGNLAVHAVARFLDAMGIATGVDLEGLNEGLRTLERLVDRRLIATAGYLGICALFSFFGVIHSVDPAGGLYLPWGIAGDLHWRIGLGYVVFALLMAGLSFMPEKES